MRLALVVCVLVSQHQLAAADDGVSRHLFYGELLGKAGEYGVGYELALSPRLALGAAGSFAGVRDQRLATFAPYLHLTLLAHHTHALFAELGAVVTHSKVPSPVSSWDGMTATGGGGFASIGYQHATRHLVMRATGSAIVGEGGIGPAVGFTIGIRP